MAAGTAAPNLNEKDMTEATCENCIWWARNEPGGEVGECRKSAPQLYACGRSGKPPGTAWPQTTVEDWCAEFTVARLPNQAGQNPANREARIAAARKAGEGPASARAKTGERNKVNIDHELQDETLADCGIGAEL